MTRAVLRVIALVLALAVAALFLPVDFLRPAVERALARGLGRRVEVGSVHVNLFGAPGLTLEDVVIHEDPRAGIEPFAYVESLGAGVRWLSLFHRHLDFSSLNLGDATVNLVKTNDGPWSFQYLLNDAQRSGMIPAIKMRKGRVNFKFGDTKSVFYFNRADLDLAPLANGAVELRFGGEPSRTDRPAQDFGLFFVTGRWTTGAGSRIDLNVDLERSSLDEVSRFIDPRGFGLQGVVALKAQLSGPPAELAINGELQVGDVHRWDLLSKGGRWSMPFKGTLNLRQDKLELASTEAPGGSPVVLQFRTWDFLTVPHWEAGARFLEVPLAALVEVARHMGAPFPVNIASQGSVSGSIDYTQASGLSGRIELSDASVTLPGAEPLLASSATVDIEGGSAHLENSTVQIGEKDSAEVEAGYTLSSPRILDLRIATRGLSIANMRSFGVAAIPLLDRSQQGTWHGWARFHAGEWSGDYELQNVRIAIEGLADPLRIQSAAVKLNEKSVTLSRLRAQAGRVAFSGEYRWEPDAVRPHQFNIAIAEADAAELERLLAPALTRERGLLARTLRLSAAPPPDWLKARRADGIVSVGELALGDAKVHLQKARLLWDAAVVRIIAIDGAIDRARISGDLEVDLDGLAPHYRFDGKLTDVPYKGGKLDFEGTFEADGAGAQLLDMARAEGELRGQSIAFASDADFRAAAACFEMQGARWKLSEVEVVQGTETYSGTGTSQADGKLLLEVTRGGQQVRYVGQAISSPVN